MKSQFTKMLTLASLLAAAVPTLTVAQTDSMQGMDMKDSDMKGMDMKEMDMKEMDMKEMDMKEMDMKGMQGMHKSPSQQVHEAQGVVKKVDSAAGEVTLAHGPVATLKWSAMTMAFKVQDKSLLKQLEVGKKVNFSFVQQGADYVITAVK